MKLLRFSIILALTLGVPVIHSLDPTVESVIDRLIGEEFLPINNIPGLGLSIFNGDDNDPTMVRGYGSRNLEGQVKTSTSTLFGIGSVSKSFVGLMVVKTLSEKFPELGESALDTPIRKFLPSANFTLIDRFRSESVTFRDLVAHRLCTLPEFLGLTTAPFKDKYEFLYRQRYAPKICSFRTEFQYNNGAFALASELIATIAGKTMEELLMEIYKDLEMAESTYYQEEVDYDFRANMSRSYYRNGTQLMKFNSNLIKRVTVAVGAGGVLSTPNDMLKYIQFYLNKGKVGNKQIISEEAMSWLGKSVNSVPFNGFKTETDVIDGDFGYGLGYFIGTHDGYERISHGGYIPPFMTMLSFYPAFNLGIFTSINGPGYLNPGSDFKVLHAEFFKILTGNNPSPPGSVFKQLEFPTRGKLRHVTNTGKTDKSQKLEPNEIVGLYGNGLSGEFTVTALPETETTGEYYIRYGLWGTGIMRPLSDTTYEIEWDSDLAQEDYVYGPVKLPPPILDFSEPDMVLLDVADGTRIAFIKNLTLDKLPVQPWDPDSCGPATV